MKNKLEAYRRRMTRLVTHLLGLPSPERIEARKLALAQHEFFFREACKAFGESQYAWQKGDIKAHKQASLRHRTASLRMRAVVIPSLANVKKLATPPTGSAETEIKS